MDVYLSCDPVFRRGDSDCSGAWVELCGHQRTGRRRRQEDTTAVIFDMVWDLGWVVSVADLILRFVSVLYQERAGEKASEDAA